MYKLESEIKGVAKKPSSVHWSLVCYLLEGFYNLGQKIRMLEFLNPKICVTFLSLKNWRSIQTFAGKKLKKIVLTKRKPYECLEAIKHQVCVGQHTNFISNSFFEQYFFISN